jgi:hypothetical protein
MALLPGRQAGLNLCKIAGMYEVCRRDNFSAEIAIAITKDIARFQRAQIADEPHLSFGGVVFCADFRRSG